MLDLPADYDILFLSGCCDMHNVGLNVTANLYLAQVSRVSSMYLISQKGARNMLRSFPLVAPIDFQMNYAAGYENQWLKSIQATADLAPVTSNYITQSRTCRVK